MVPVFQGGVAFYVGCTCWCAWHSSWQCRYITRDLILLLTSPPSGAEVIQACRQTIKEWREYYAELSSFYNISQYVGQCLSALGLTYARQDSGFVLYADYSLGAPLGLCLLVSDDDLGRTTKGRHHQANLVRTLRQQSLDWGIVTNGRDRRLCNAAASAPYELHLQVGLDSMLAGRDSVDFSLFHRFFGRGAFVVNSDGPDTKLCYGLDGYGDLSAGARRPSVICRGR